MDPRDSPGVQISIILFSAHKETTLICYDLILLRKLIIASDYAVVTNITVSACSAANERSVDLFYAKEITVAQKRQDM